jgi:hypothetical protein
VKEVMGETPPDLERGTPIQEVHEAPTKDMYA